jgi:hypothetical protein
MVDREHFAMVHATLAYLNETPGREFVREIIGVDELSYVNQKAEVWKRSPVEAIAALSETNFERLVEAVVKLHLEEGRKRADRRTA